MARDPVFELDLTLPPPGARTRVRDLHGQLRAAIFDGRLKPGLQVPPSRALASRLAVSRNTVVSVYELLLAEGYLVARTGSGTYVGEVSRPGSATPPAAASAADPRLAPAWRDIRAQRALRPSFAFDFALGLPEVSLAPFDVWRQLANRALRATARRAAAYLEAEGRPALREAVARHAAFARAVACTPDSVLITSGAQQAFDLLARVLVTPGETVVAVEDPGYAPVRAPFARLGAIVRPTPVDDEGLVVDALAPDTRVVCVTPSHQFPLGVPMSPARRAALLAFAARHGAVVVEDDYDGEFRFDGRPLDALQTLDRHACVAYVGTFSKSLFPGLRLGYVVAPDWARAALAEAKRIADGRTPTDTQETLAAFIAEGHLARHVRRMRKVYGERRNRLMEALTRQMPGRLLPAVAGLHLAIELPPDIDATALSVRAERAGIAVAPLSRFHAGGGVRNGLAFGYGVVDPRRIDDGIRHLAGLV
ncbi:MAG: PLP-dependent aminotransferase family protein [Caulobacterales bacterium]|nr:PLP-dependent aminotransferase family protein [Caulobacterales bacterium]